MSTSTPRRSNRVNIGIPPQRLGGASVLARASASTFPVNMANDASGSESESELERTIREQHNSDEPIGDLGVPGGAAAPSGQDSRRSSFSSRDERLSDVAQHADHLRNILRLNKRVIDLQAQVEAGQQARNALISEREQMMSMFDEYKAQHSEMMTAKDSLSRAVRSHALPAMSSPSASSESQAQPPSPALQVPPTSSASIVPQTSAAQATRREPSRWQVGAELAAHNALVAHAGYTSQTSGSLATLPPAATYTLAGLPSTTDTHWARTTGTHATPFASADTPIVAPRFGSHLAPQSSAVSHWAPVPSTPAATYASSDTPLAPRHGYGPALIAPHASTRTHMQDTVNMQPHGVQAAATLPNAWRAPDVDATPTPITVDMRPTPGHIRQLSGAFYMSQPAAFAGQPPHAYSAPANGAMYPYQMSGNGWQSAHRRLQDLPNFSGRPEEWPMFASAFINTTNAYGYTELENLIRLQKSLTGEAKQSVECLLIHPQHVGQAMTRLEAVFGRPDQLVRSQISRARQLPSIKADRIFEIVAFANCVNNLAAFLDAPSTFHHLADPTLLEELIRKLPMASRVTWASVARRIRPHPTLRDFALWITEEADLVASVAFEAVETTQNATGSGSGGRRRHVLLNFADQSTSGQDDDKEGCMMCAGDHLTSKCKDFLRLTVKERWEVVLKKGACFSCLGLGHILKNCDRKTRCEIDGCSRSHHRKLHDKHFNKTDAPSADSGQNARPQKPNTGRTSRPRGSPSRPDDGSEQTERDQRSDEQNVNIQEASSMVNHCRELKRESTLLFRVVPVTLHGPGGDVSTFALLDEGSSITLLDDALSQELELTGPRTKLSVHWFSSKPSVEDSRRVSFDITGQQSGCSRFSLQNVRTIKDMSLPAQTIDMAAIGSRCPHLRQLPIMEYTNARPRLLIGLDHHYLGVPTEIQTGPEHRGIAAARTALGWVLYGSDGPPPVSIPRILHIHDADDNRYDLLSELVRSHFSTEQFGVKAAEVELESDDLKKARRILKETTKRVTGGFETGLLWRVTNVRLPPSFDMALRRLKSVEFRMKRDPVYAEMYNAQIESYVQKGYARRLDEAEVRETSSRTWFLPHFAVFNANKPGKFRLVFDAAATVDGVSLNTQLLTGPDVNVPLVKLLLQFRLGAVGIVADIKEMFHQVKIREADQTAQRFLWRHGDPTKPPNVYAMMVMTFGATCSPASAQHVKNINAAEFADEFPAAAEAIHNRHYVDDYVASYNTAGEAARITGDVIEVHRRGGFELRGFVSNSQEVMTILGGNTGSGGQVNMQLDSDASEKVLGMCWNTDQDAFQFRTQFSRVHPDVMNGRRTPTKREVLSVAMSVFDPYGLLADFMLESKLILQDLWRTGLDWDTPIPEHLDQRWNAWRSEVERTKLLRVPRCYSTHMHSSTDIQLHIFADASEVAFSAVAYWRIVCPGGIEVSFVLGRTRCAPLKVLTVPRLELQAAVLATRLLAEVQNCHPDLQIARTVLWSDSATVLSWLRSDQRKFKPFVQFRVAEILEAAPISCWRWVPTLLNVADDATRVTLPPKFCPDSRWIRGPDWLKLREGEWPTTALADDCLDEVDASQATTAETRRNFVGAAREQCTIIIYERFCTYRRLCRVAALVQRYMSNLRSAKSRRVMGELDAREMESGTLMLCRLVQEEAYSKEIATLKREEMLASTSDIYTLNVYLENDGLLRIYGRTDAAADEHLPFDTRRPILLPRSHRFTRLLVHHHHEQSAHQLSNATLAAIRRRFWIPKVRVLLNSVQAQCVHCKRRTARPIPPVQGQLPADRLTPYVRPFCSTGMDYFGPVFVTIGRRREKRWVVVFTCLAVRAIHLEVAADLTTDACLVCVRNLCHLRGTPTRIRCDNGTNFVGARNMLAKDENFIDAVVMQRELCAKGIQWVMNCPGNPKTGGIWERMVQGVKRILAVTLKEDAPRVETLRAHLLEAANMLNSRPLTHLPVSPDDQEALTPNHFLIGGPNAATMTSPTEAEPAWVRQQWRICRELSRKFWKQWVLEYLPELTRRSKNYPERKELAIDDVVIVCDENQPRGKWPLGRVVSVVQGSDGRVRSATVKTADGTLRRPLTRLAVLDLEPAST